MIKDNTNDILNEADRLIKQRLEQATLLVERTAKQPGYCPVKTGTARRSITHEMALDGKFAKVGSNVEYFPYIEMGTVKMTARAPLRRALHDNMPKIKRIFSAK